jgi:hypothetical protein
MNSNMKAPKNLEKLNGYEMGGPSADIHFLFETGVQNDNEIWMFDETGDYMGHYCTLITLNWNENQYHIRKCVRGRGYDGEDIPGVFPLQKEFCKSMADFAEYMKEHVIRLSQLMIYSN